MTKLELINELLEAWEETYKKGQLTIWIFLALRDGKKYVEQIKEFIEHHTNGSMSCQEQSLYRSLRKYQHVGVVDFETGDGHKGPERKYYYLTSLGSELLRRFITRNIAIFLKPNVKQLLNQGLSYENH